MNNFAQKADSLEAVILKTKVDSTKTIVWSLLADELTKSNPKKAFESARAGLALARKIGFEKGIFENCFSLATAFQGAGFVRFRHLLFPNDHKFYTH